MITVLLVEDEDSIRSLLADALGKAGITVLTAGDGNQALQIARGHQGTIDVLVTDMVMPNLSGRQLAEELHVTHPNTTIVFMSGYMEDRTLPDRRQINSTYLQKPFTPSELLRHLADVLADGAARAMSADRS